MSSYVAQPAAVGGASVPAPADVGRSYVQEPTDESGDGDVAAADQDTFESAAPAVSFGSDAQRADGLQRRLDALEAEVERLRTLDAEVARLRADLNDLRAQLGG